MQRITKLFLTTTKNSRSETMHKNALPCSVPNIPLSTILKESASESFNILLKCGIFFFFQITNIFFLSIKPTLTIPRIQNMYVYIQIHINTYISIHTYINNYTCIILRGRKKGVSGCL